MNMSEVAHAEVLLTTLSRRGTGVPSAPIRVVEQLWTHDGALVAEFDPESGEPHVFLAGWKRLFGSAR